MTDHDRATPGAGAQAGGDAAGRAPAPAVVITGASSGIGRATALALAAAGYRVFAGVRRAEDAERLTAEAPGATSSIVPLILDVCDPTSIAAAAEFVTHALAGPSCDLESRISNLESSPCLAGLVNNAGIVVPGPLEFVPGEALDRQFRVNVLGVAAVTRALLPLLRRGRGRIINMSSISGRLSMPVLGPYAASKFALEALSDAWRVELRPWGIAVSLIEPGPVATPIWSKSRSYSEQLARDCPPATREAMESLYGPMLRKMDELVARAERRAIAPEAVAGLVLRILRAPRPRARYPIGRGVALQSLLAGWLPDRVKDWLIAREL